MNTLEISPVTDSKEGISTKAKIIGGAVLAVGAGLVAVDFITHGAVRDVFTHAAAFFGYDSAPSAPVTPGCEIICPQEGGPVMGS